MSLPIARQARACGTDRETPHRAGGPISVIGAGCCARTATARASISGGRIANSPRIPGHGRYKRARPYPRAAAARRTSWVRTGGRRRARERSSLNLSQHRPPQELCRHTAPNVLNQPCTTIRRGRREDMRGLRLPAIGAATVAVVLTFLGSTPPSQGGDGAAQVALTETHYLSILAP